MSVRYLLSLSQSILAANVSMVMEQWTFGTLLLAWICTPDHADGDSGVPRRRPPPLLRGDVAASIPWDACGP